MFIFNDSAISWKYKVKYCTNHIMKVFDCHGRISLSESISFFDLIFPHLFQAGTVRCLADSIFFRSWEERYIILCGRYLYVFDIGLEITRKQIIEVCIHFFLLLLNFELICPRIFRN